MADPLAPDLQRALDRSELSALVAELSSAVDRGDRDRIAACYSDHSFDDHGPFKGSGADFADFVTGPGALGTMHHQLGQSVFEVDGDEAFGETFFVFHGTFGRKSVSGHGRYVDHFRRMDGRWKLHYRRVVPDAVPEGDDIAAYWAPGRAGDDPSYDRRRGPDA